MASRTHQRILAIVTRTMRSMGYVIVAQEGAVESLGRRQLSTPGRVGRHRPDVFGVADDGRRCVGEAKTASDLSSRRTREQLEDYLRPGDEGYLDVVLGFPSSTDRQVSSLLRAIGAIDCPQLRLIPVPDELLDA